MKRVFLWFAGLAILIAAGMVHAGTVYEWTDENGVRHFSNTGAPPDVGSVETTDEKRVPPEAEEEAEQETQQAEEEILSNAPSTNTNAPPTVREQAEQLEQERLDRRVAEERRRLEANIKQIEGRAIGSGFTEGMRTAQLSPLKEQLDLLNSNPEQYFRMKNQGAFN